MLEEIINSSTGLIWKISKMFYGVDKNDLYQAGVLGVIKAYQNYKQSDAKFSTYAYNYIYGEMYLVANNKEIRLNKNIERIIKYIERGKYQLMQELLREPSIDELSLYLEMDKDKISTIMSYAKTFISMDEDNNDTRDLHEVISKDEDISTLEKIALNDSINNLDVLEKNIIRSRYFEDLTQCETAKKLGISQVKVSRYEQRSLKKMRDYMYM